MNFTTVLACASCQLSIACLCFLATVASRPLERLYPLEGDLPVIT